MKSEIPKRLKVDRSCFYELPDDTPAHQLPGYEAYFRERYRGEFMYRMGLRYFFSFRDSRSRDKFLTICEVQGKQQGLILKRVTIY
jgi:hypothetical protein